MAKIIRKKRKFKLNSFINLVFVLSLMSYLTAVTLLHSHNVSLNYELANVLSENDAASEKLETLRLEVTSYTEREYLLSMCNDNGEALSYSQARVSYIHGAN